ncbi:unnamed protein product [Plutella xylostella]|uniref:(diamondback moth) hypothetical protein n=1 Tax=Plutella xylostella TaxID=51655 RepID=A0A8S4G2X9_PLUXY|nr:unnamed protein product [Plutella xylostella]
MFGNTVEPLCERHVAVSTLDGNISFFSVSSGEARGGVEGRADLGAGRGDTDLVTAEKMLKTK